MNKLNLTELLTEDMIILDLKGESKVEVIHELISLLEHKGFLTNKEVFTNAVFDREEEGTTGIGFNIAIPHGKSNAIKKPAIVFGKKENGIDWNSFDGTDAKLIFLIGVPEKNAGDEHLKILQLLSRKLIDDDFRSALLDAPTKEDIIELLAQI